MEITGEQLDAFRKDFDKAMVQLQDKYDVTISLGAITYEEERFSARVTVKNGQDPEEIARADFDADVYKFAHLGLGPGMYKRVFIGNNGERFAIVGFNTRAKKYPLEIIRIRDGSRRKAGEGFIKELVNEYYAENLAEGQDS